jgi:hypothetical protein
VGYTPAGTGAVATDVENALNSQGNKISVLRWIPPAEWAAIFDYTSTYDCTSAVQAAVNTRQGYAPLGLYNVDTINIPNCIDGGVSRSFSFTAEPDTIFQARTANQPVFQKIDTSGSVDNGTLGPFTVKPHASGSTTGAIKCTGFRGSIFDRIKGVSNGASGFNTLFDVSASPWLCYANTWIKPHLSGTAGYTRMFYFNNAATTEVNNSNVGTILDVWAVDNTGMTCVIDALRSSDVTLFNGLIENNAGALALNSGNSTKAIGVFFELNALDIDYSSAAGQGTANDGLVMGCYFSTPHNVNFYGTQSGNLWLNNTGAGAQTFINNTYQNFKSKVSGAAGIVDPTVPTITFSTGQTGVLTLGAATRTQQINQLSGDVVMSMLATWTAGTATTNSKFTLAVPAGFTFKSATAALIRDASGEPGIICFDSASSFWVHNKYNDAQSIALTVVYSRT